MKLNRREILKRSGIVLASLATVSLPNLTFGQSAGKNISDWFEETNELIESGTLSSSQIFYYLEQMMMVGFARKIKIDNLNPRYLVRDGIEFGRCDLIGRYGWYFIAKYDKTSIGISVDVSKKLVNEKDFIEFGKRLQEKMERVCQGNFVDIREKLLLKASVS